MTEPKRKHRDQQPVKTRYFQGALSCQRCATTFLVRDLNEHRKVIFCAVCGEQNDIQKAKGRAV